MPVGLTHLRALVAVVDAGGFGAAAGTLGVSQSAVSHAVAALERMAGRAVLTRERVPRPTPLGERMLEHARTAVAAVSAVEELAGRRDEHVQGEVILAAPPTVCHGLLPDLLARWRADFPAVRVSLLEGEDDDVVAWLDGGVADLGVLVDAPPGAGTVLGTDRFHAVLRSDHPLAGLAEIDLADLADDELLLSVGGCERHIRELHHRAGTRFAPAHRVRQLSTLFTMVGSGFGVSVVPGLAAGMPGPGVLLVPLTQRLHRTLTLTGPTTRPWHPIAAALVAAASSRARQTGRPAEPAATRPGDQLNRAAS